MKVFRLTNNGNAALSNNVDWFVSNEYNSSVIQSIPDPDGGKGNEPTSIPSPFARMDLVRTSFKYVNEGANPNSTFYKIVSDTLDVAELFFNLSRLKDITKIHVWDRGTDMNVLNSGSKEHKSLADSLDLYLSQDSSSFHFDQVTIIYLLEYKSKIIGGTSPLTLFFPSSNNLSWVDHVFPNGDKAFDNSPLPLNRRDPEFQKMMYALRASYPMFSSIFREVDIYLDKNLDELNKFNNPLYLELTQIKNGTLKIYNTSNYDIINNGIYIIGNVPLYTSKNLPIKIESDFEIVSHKYSATRKPMVLKNGNSSIKPDGNPMKYYHSTYDSRITIPHFVKEQNLENRELPGVSGIHHPFLTIGDFLEPYAIKTLFPINENFFHIGNFRNKNGKSKRGYLLPIKKRYFDFFDVEDLNKRTSDGNDTFEMTELGSSGLKVVLRVPIKDNNYIEYERIYYPSELESRPSSPDETNNKGAIIELDFSLSLFPTFKLSNVLDNFFRICLVEADNALFLKKNEYKLFLYKQNGASVNPTKVQKRSVKSNRDPVNSYHYIVNNDDFEFIELTTGLGANGIIAPKLKTIISGSRESVFAIDFGTTNTHIEYLFTGEDHDPSPLEILQDDRQIATLHSVNDDMMNENISSDSEMNVARALNRIIPRFIYETMPDYISKKNDFSFPTRTALASRADLNIISETYTMADLNIPFYFEKMLFVPTVDKIVKNLKWGSQKKEDDKYTEHFFENLVFLIRNKILLNNGDLRKISIVCSYPTSMLSWRKELLENTWSKLFAKYFSDALKPKFISESIAPFYFLKKRGGITAINKPVLSIDIGGESTDFVVYINDKPEFVSSIRFATNAIFGDGFNRNPQTNGFVLKYNPEISKLIEKNKLSNLKNVLDVSSINANSSDIINLFFAIENNKLLNPNKLVSFNSLLERDSDFKIIFVIYYAAIIFHIAKLMKAKNIDAPAYLTFSGMGSKVINTIGKNAVNILSNAIFKKVTNCNSINVSPIPGEPKEITAKGGVFYGLEKTNNDGEHINIVLLGDEVGTIIDENNPFTYNDLNEKIYRSVFKEYLNFINLFEELGQEINFGDKFGFTKDQFKVYKETLTNESKIMEFIKLGVNHKKEQLNNYTSQPIEESLFFYPLIGVINLLAYEIYENNQK